MRCTELWKRHLTRLTPYGSCLSACACSGVISIKKWRGPRLKARTIWPINLFYSYVLYLHNTYIACIGIITGSGEKQETLESQQSSSKKKGKEKHRQVTKKRWPKIVDSLWHSYVHLQIYTLICETFTSVTCQKMSKTLINERLDVITETSSDISDPH